MAGDSPARCVSPGRCASPVRCVSAGREPSAARPGSPSSAGPAGPGVRPEVAACSGASGSRQSRGAVGFSSAASRSPVGAWKPGGTSKPDAAVPTGGTWTAGGAEVGNPGSAQRARCAAAGSTVDCGARPGSGSAAPCSAGGAGRWAGTTSRSLAAPGRPSAGSPGGALTGVVRPTGGSRPGCGTPLTSSGWCVPLTWWPLVRAGDSGSPDRPTSGDGRSPCRVEEVRQPDAGSGCQRGASSRASSRSAARGHPPAGGAHPLTERLGSSC